MSPEDTHKQKNHPQSKPGWWRALEGILERLGEGFEDIARGLQPQPKPIPIPVPTRQPRRR